MSKLNTTNYNFLKNFRPELFKLAEKMEKDLLIAPISMLAYSTRFLEYILYDIARLNDYKVNTEIGFVRNIYELIQLGHLEYYLGDLLIKAYVFRNTSIHNTNITKSLKEDKKTAFELNKRLFDIVDQYYKNITNNYDEHIYIEPTLNDELYETKTIIKQERYFDKCIICGNSNNLSKSNFCEDCDDLLNYREVLSKIITHKGKNALLKRNDFDCQFKNKLISVLLDKNILENVGNNYTFVNVNLDNYFKLTDKFMEIDEFLVDYVNNAIENPRNSKFYTSGEYPYLQVSKIIDEHDVRELLNLYEQGFSHEYCFEHMDITRSDLKNWYCIKKSEFLDGNKDDLFIKYNEFSIKDLFRSIEKTHEPNVSHETINFWADNFDGFSEKLSNKLSKRNLTLFMQLFKMNSSKEYVLNQLNITRHDFDKYISMHKRLADEYFEEVERRKGYVLIHLKEMSLEDALENAKLDKIDFEKDKKDYLNGHENEFYKKATEILQQRYLEYRKKGLKTCEICEKLAIGESEVDLWFNEESFENKYSQVRLTLFKRAVKSKKSKNEICDALEITDNDLNNLIKLGEDGDSRYAKFYNYFKNDYYPLLIEQFLEEFHQKANVSIALKNTNLTKSDLNNYFKSHDELYNQFMDIKIDKIVTTFSNKGKVNTKLLKRLDVSKEEYAKYENRINKEVLDKQLEFISNEIYKGDIVYRASKKVNCDIDTVFDWIYKGSIGDEKFENLANFYWEEHLFLLIDGNSELKDGVPINALKKNINPPQLKFDVEYWKKWGLLDKKNVDLKMGDIKNIIKNYRV